MRALLIIDMQKDFIQKGAPLEVEDIGKSLSKQKNFIEFCRKQGMLIIYTRHIFDPKKNSIEAKLFPKMNFLQENTKGSKIVEELGPEQNDAVIKKTRYDAFIGTELENILRNNKVSQVIITGTMTNICCESTARTAMMKDFEVLFCSDLTYTNHSELHEATLKNIQSHFGTVMTSEQIISHFNQS